MSFYANNVLGKRGDDGPCVEYLSYFELSNSFELSLIFCLVNL